MDLTDKEIYFINKIYNILSKNNKTKINVFTYYEDVDWMDNLLNLPVNGIGLDFVNGRNNYEKI